MPRSRGNATPLDFLRAALPWAEMIGFGGGKVISMRYDFGS
jgi:hypothetical protein